jgi:hypothetical protein
MEAPGSLIARDVPKADAILLRLDKARDAFAAGLTDEALDSLPPASMFTELTDSGQAALDATESLPDGWDGSRLLKDYLDYIAALLAYGLLLTNSDARYGYNGEDLAVPAREECASLQSKVHAEVAALK